LLLVALVVGLLVGAADPQKDLGKKGATALEGTWVVVSITYDGEEKAEKEQFIFQGKNLIVKTKEGDRKATFQIDAKGTLDLTSSEDGRKTRKGIYQLKGGDLKLCYSLAGKDRPKDFTAEKDSGRSLIVLKRAKDKGDKTKKELAPMKGTVTLDGKPLANVTVVFVG
jgi:uncharacterized protein (TIGR03067 family)